MNVETERFKPIPVRRGEGLFARAAYGARLLVDLQLLTCHRFLRPIFPQMLGKVLDVGCGDMPFRGFLPKGADYTGLDVPVAIDFGAARNSEIVEFDGVNIPFPDASFDHVLCTEVLEHAIDPDALVKEMHRVLRPGGALIVTVPFSARVHHAPWDFHRFTPYRLAILCRQFKLVEISPRGNDLAVIANKLIVLCARSRRPSGWPVLVLTAPFALLALAIAHLSMLIGRGSTDDPLGYGVQAVKE